VVIFHFMRIASLLASATEIVYGLGLEKQLVAISHECDYPPEALAKPRVSRPRFDPQGLDSGAIDRAVRAAMAGHGSVYVLDEDRLGAVDPELILTQAVCEVCAVPTSLAQEAARVLGREPRILSLDAHSVGEVMESIRLVGEAAGVPPDRVSRYVTSLRTRIEAVEAWVHGAAQPRVLAIEWLDPPFVPGHWTPEMITLAGGANVLGEAGEPSREVAWEELAETDPDVLIVMPCGYGLDAAKADADRHATHLIAVAERAIESGHAFVVDGSAYFNRSGPRLVDGIEILAALLHPERFDDDLDGCAARWEPAVPSKK
jgi:iron complex transport system substrate-binding protein